MDKALSTISPEQIDTGHHFFGAFDKMETEVSARWIVRFCQQRERGWEPFTYAELENFYHERGRPLNEDFRFNGLLRADERWLSLHVDEQRAEEVYSVTDAFVAQCYAVAPRTMKAKRGSGRSRRGEGGLAPVAAEVQTGVGPGEGGSGGEQSESGPVATGV